MFEVIFGSLFVILIASITLAVSLALYFIPSIIAYVRNHKYRIPIFVLNLLAGVTVIGWIAAFIWAFIDSKPVFNFGKPTLAQELKELSELVEKGILTQEEFEIKKKQLLEKEG